MPAPTKDRTYERWRLRIFLVTWLAYAGYYLTRKGFSVAKNELKQPEVLGLTKHQMSVMDVSFSAGYALGQFVFGALGDRFGSRRIVLWGMMASLLTSALMGFSTSALAIGMLFALQGVWQSSGWAPLAKNMGQFFSRTERGTILGLWCTNYAFGGFAATIIAAYAASAWGWRYAFFVPAALLLVIWVVFYLFQRDRPEDAGLPPIEEYHGEAVPMRAPGLQHSAGPRAAAEPSGWEALGEVMRNRMVWFLAAIYFLVKPTRYLLLFWSPVYISERMGTDTAASGLLSSMFDLAGPVGTLVGGVVSDRLFGSKRMPVCVLSLFFLAVLMVIFPYVPVSRAGMGLGMFVMGFLVFIPDSLLAGAAAIDFGTKQGASAASGLINGFGSVGQMIGVALPGALSMYYGPGRDVWTVIFVGLGLSLALAGLLLAPFWHRVPKQPA